MTTHADVAFEFGLLTAVRLGGFEEQPKTSDPWFNTTVELFFERGTFVVRALPEFDTVETIATPGLPSSLPKSIPDGPWGSVIGRDLIYLWVLTNHQGYEDGIQMEFRTDDGFFQIQLMVEASAFRWYTLTDVTPVVPNRK